MMANYTLGLRLRRARRRKAFSQRALAEASEVSARQISQIETGKIQPQPRTVAKLAKALTIPIPVLVGETDMYDAPRQVIQRELPLFGTIPAGPPIDCDNPLSVVPVLAHQWAENRYVLRITGDSMYPKYQRNDLVLVEHLEAPDLREVHGKTCVCLYRGESTLKIVETEKRGHRLDVILKGFNPNSPTIVIDKPDELIIQGCVLKLIERND